MVELKYMRSRYSDNKKYTPGFTIVELLIVIVVIAILAVISIVAYNGLQNRANDSSKSSILSVYVRTLNLYYADKSAYPGLSGSTLCLDGSGNCWPSGVSANSVESIGVRDELLKYTNPLPSFKGMAYAYGVQSSPSGNVTGRYIAFEIMGSNCPIVGGTSFLNRTGSAGAFVCRIALQQ